MCAIQYCKYVFSLTSLILNVAQLNKLNKNHFDWSVCMHAFASQLLEQQSEGKRSDTSMLILIYYYSQLFSKRS